MVHVRGLNGGLIATADSLDSNSVQSVKRAIHALRCIPPPRQRLIHPSVGLLKDSDDIPSPSSELQLVCLAPDPDKGPVLLEHVLRDDKTAVDRLLHEEVADPNYMNANGETPLVAACRRGHLEIVESLCNAGADIEQHSGDECINPVFAAADAGSIDVIERLSAMGADIHKPISNGATPLHVASFKGHLDVVRLLCTPHPWRKTSRPSFFGALSVALRARQIASVLELLCNFHWVVLWSWEE